MAVLLNHNNAMLRIAPEVAGYVEAIKKKLQLSIFVYVRIYNDRSCFLLTDNSHWLQHHLKHGYSTPAPLTVNNCDQVVYNQIKGDDVFLQAKHDLCHIFDANDAMDIACKRKNYTEIFTWSLPVKASEDIRTVYLKNQKYFDGFMDNFVNDFRFNIKEVAKHKIVLPKSMCGLKFDVSDCHTILPRFTITERKCLNYLASSLQSFEISKCLSVSKRTVEKHLASIRLKMHCNNNVEVVTKYFNWKRGFLAKDCNVLTRDLASKFATNKKLSLLTARQRDCLLALAQGLTIKQMAYKFKISVRTAEKHFEHIKIKLNCNSYLDIVAKYCS